MSNMDLVFKIVDFLKTQRETFPEVARLLRFLHEAEPEALPSICQATGISRRKAYYLIELDRHFAPLAVTPRRLAKIGWTKASVIAPHLEKMDPDELLLMAEMHTVMQLRAALKGPAKPAKSATIRFKFSVLQHQFLLKRLEAHGFTGNGSAVSKEAALMAALRLSSTG